MQSGHESGRYGNHIGDQNEGAAPELEALPRHLSPGNWFLIILGAGAFLLALPFSEEPADVLGSFAIATAVFAAANVVLMWDGMKRIAPAPPGAAVGHDRPPRVRALPVVLVTMFFGGWLALVAADLLPASSLGFVGGVLLGNGLADAWERRKVRRVQQRQGRRLLRPRTSNAVFKREYFAAP
ncbi:MAG: hypothetical protein M3179_02350 [Actinomycetota bacterium]|nr:hypothetical protein [Actinomycetota bacterium]